VTENSDGYSLFCFLLKEGEKKLFAKRKKLHTAKLQMRKVYDLCNKKLTPHPYPTKSAIYNRFNQI
jgi:hypothetical protein